VHTVEIQNMVELTNREREILLHIAQGYSSLDIANKLFVSKGTIETHRRNIMQKLSTNKMARVIILALHHGIIEIDENCKVRLCLP